jgi:hypothetical protein
MTELAASGKDRSVRKRPLRSFQKILLLLAGLTIALLLAEVGLRIGGFSHFNPYIADRELGAALRPDAEGWWRREGDNYVTINSQGLRDREHAIAKPHDVIRIAVLGDSFAEAFQVPMEQTFWTVMEQKLSPCAAGTGRKVEVLNFGVSGFSTARELVMLRQRVWQYSPDIILLLVTTRNDVRDNSPALNRYKNSPLPYFVNQEGSLRLDDSRLQMRNDSVFFRLRQSFVGRSFDWLRAHSRVIGLLDATRDAYLWKQEQTGNKDGDGAEVGLDDEVFSPPSSSDWREAWDLTERLITQMRDEVEAKGAKFLVVTGSSSIQVNPDTELRNEYMKRLKVQTLLYPDLRIKGLGESAGVEVLTLAPFLLDYATRNQVLLHGSNETKGKGHWNQTGHRLVGELIAEKLCEPGWLKGQ